MKGEGPGNYWKVLEPLVEAQRTTSEQESRTRKWKASQAFWSLSSDFLCIPDQSSSLCKRDFLFCKIIFLLLCPLHRQRMTSRVFLSYFKSRFQIPKRENPISPDGWGTLYIESCLRGERYDVQYKHGCLKPCSPSWGDDWGGGGG